MRAVGPGLLAADEEEGVAVGHGGGVGEEVLVGDHGAEGPGVGGKVVDLGGRGGDAAGAGNYWSLKKLFNRDFVAYVSLNESYWHCHCTSILSILVYYSRMICRVG